MLFFRTAAPVWNITIAIRFLFNTITVLRHILSLIVTRCVFRCDRISAETWSSMFGHSEQIKVSTTNSSPKSLLGALNTMNYVLGGMLAKSSPLRGSRSVTRSKEDQPNVPPELLSTLRYGKAWCRYPNGGFTEGKITRGWF